jgi:hypothetical protein
MAKTLLYQAPPVVKISKQFMEDLSQLGKLEPYFRDVIAQSRPSELPLQPELA